MIHTKDCNCGQCRLVRGEAISGSCAVCKLPGMFVADDIVVIAGMELFTHYCCRMNRTRLHNLERELLE